MGILAPTLCLLLVPQVPHKAPPEVEGQLLSCLISNLQLVQLQLMLQVVPHRYLMLQGVMVHIFDCQSAMFPIRQAVVMLMVFMVLAGSGVLAAVAPLWLLKHVCQVVGLWLDSWCC